MRFIETIKDAISPMRYGSGGEKALYWFLRIGTIVLGVLIVAVIAGVIYCKVNGIEIAFPV